MLLFEMRMGRLEVVIEKHGPRCGARWACERPSTNEIVVDAGRITFMLSRIPATSRPPFKGTNTAP
jgi:hypothetical protein